MGREGAAAPAGLELQLGRGAWRTGERRTGRQRRERRLGWQKGGDGISGRKENLLCITWALGPVGSIDRVERYVYPIRIHIWVRPSKKKIGYLSRYVLRGLTIRLKSISSGTYISRSTVSLSS